MPKIYAIIGAFVVPMVLTYNLINLLDTRKTPVLASEPASLEITTSLKGEQLDRHQILTDFFSKYNSPLTDHVDTFIKVADAYDLDYRLLPAISCIESSCGKKLISGSYNPFGWGIYGTNVIRFKNFDEAIAKVGDGLHKNYIAKGFDTPEKMAPIYTPTAYRHWLSSVNYFMNEMDNKQ